MFLMRCFLLHLAYIDDSNESIGCYSADEQDQRSTVATLFYMYHYLALSMFHC